MTMGSATFTETAAMQARAYSPLFNPILAPTVFVGAARLPASLGPGRGQPAYDPCTAAPHEGAAGGGQAAGDGPESASHGPVRPRSDGA